MKTALDVIRSEHRDLAAVLHGLQFLVREVRERRREPDFKVLRAMVHYIDTFPEKLHHPKEDRHLFARLRQRTTEAREVLDQLEAQHIHGAKLIRDLERYAEFHWRHMRQEEDVVLPLAERIFNAEDWREIDEAFAGHGDPLIDKGLENDFNRLFKRIVNMAPPPIGLGPEEPRRSS
jgi:hemerythrin-like domain-containing protein